MHVEAALRAVRHPRLELALEVGLHLQELEPEHLRVDRNRMIASTGSLRFVDEIVGLDGLLGHGPDGVLEDPAFTACHWRMVGERQDGVGAPAWPFVATLAGYGERQSRFDS
jgi:hypothetical protein